MKPTRAQSLVVGLEGTWPTALEAAWLAEYRPAGVILFSRNVSCFSQLRNLCKLLHDLVPGVEVCADHEGGPVSQLGAALGRPPAAWGLGILDDVGLTARVFEETGRRLRAAGIDRVLAPVADVLTEIRNPVIGARAFGIETSLVTRHTVAAVTGLLRADMQMCLKHWPGHGGSSGDSHLGETTVGAGGVPAPFESGLTAGADGVMVGHLLPTGNPVDGQPLPATLDADFLGESRRLLAAGNMDRLVLFADDVTMGALGPAMGRLGVAVPEALESGLFDPALLPESWFEGLVAAGCDRLLIRGIPLAAFPLTGGAGAAPFMPQTEPGDTVPFGKGAYEETRERLWAREIPEFADTTATVRMLDYTKGDRWEAASGRPGDTLAACEKRLAGFFRAVVSGGSLPAGEGPCRRLLVTSHRPLVQPDAQWEEIRGSLAPEGVCVVLGHPSLKPRLEADLGPGWQVGALFDVTVEDLFSEPREAEQ